ncbi:MAG: chromosome segregation protein SMC [Gammaproteobacteria bacterium]|nr:chromosome segregation protein SMC [Gammaproteobacteria bacterium]
MRLKKIKLSGFKSFVDVTTVPVEKNLIGIVGPNGCGKSNVIDAVRCVMGESSAKNLRGDSMTDVIFNGSSGRKPVGQASIELVFDNTSNPIVGQYANYNEIAIKRVMTREGQSNYYLNNTRCRRKDLADVFLGTGLGPRSYSIIEQGMISRVIEAKPEELRIYLEEAAGISKYKERRRETEIRIKHTRENLDRVNDIRSELDKQLEKLSRQSQAAEKYKILKQDFTAQEKYDLGLQYKKLELDYNEVTAQVNQQYISLEELNSQSQSSNTELEHNKIAVSRLHHEQQQEQAKYFKVEQAINNTEQEIKHKESEQAYCNQNLANLAKQLSGCTHAINTKTQNYQQICEELNRSEPEFDHLALQKTEVLAKLKNIEQEYSTWEQQWREQQEIEHTNSKIVNQTQAVIEKHDTLIVRTQSRVETLKQEQKELKQQNNDQEIKSLKNNHQEYVVILEQKQQELEQVIADYKSIEEQITESQLILAQHNKEQQTISGKISSLETLQEAALGKDQKNLNQWLTTNKLQAVKRLGEIINITDGWELALETIINDYIKALVITDDLQFNSLDLSAADLELVAKFNTAFVHVSEKNLNLKLNLKLNDIVNNKSNKNNFELLSNKIAGPVEIAHLLNNIYCANDLAQAKNMLSELEIYESVITKDGQWLNNNWYTINKSGQKDDAKKSILTRETLIKTLKADLVELTQKISVITQELAMQKTQAQQCASKREELQRVLRANLAKQSEIKSELSRQESKAEQQRNRLFKIDQDLAEAVRHVEADSSAVKQERTKLEKAMAIMEGFTANKLLLQNTGNNLKLELKNIRTESEQLKDKLHKVELQLQKLQQQRKHLEEELDRLDKQQKRLTSDIESLKLKSEEFTQPILELKELLTSYLDDKNTQAHVLTAKNQDYDTANQSLINIEKKLTEIRKQHDLLRDKIEAAKLKQNEINIKLGNVAEALQERNIQVLDLLATLPEDLNLTTVKNKLRQLKQEIDDLGPVNLTAIEEYQVEYQRKSFLDAQEADLQEALRALEEAINQIDEETKQRFKETFDAVNQQFQYLFPKVFGGGRAELTLSGEDLLDTGVTVMAQPPGKRNATIHLLSGGEKALTAIALVFAIFRLNPAPFCMLDEVDAPLDDANVGRYCNLVKEMSKDVQFIFITHNKVAMTMAEHLIGVTMHEPGVSRLVTVDVDEAVQLVQS